MEMFRLFNLKKIGLGIAIIIVFNLFVNYGISTFYKAPKYDDFCRPEIVRQTIATKERCDGVGGLWSENVYYKNGIKDGQQITTVPAPAGQIAEPAGWCDLYFKCQKDFDGVNNIYRRNAFVIWVIAGLAAIIVSFFLVAVETVSAAFIFAGLVSLIVGTIGYWSAIQDYLRFVILGIVLAVLIYIGYKKLKDNN